MKKRGDALALALALSAGEEVTLGPSDTAMCAEALQFYANARMRSRVLKIMRIPATIIALLIGTMVVSGPSATVSRANSESSMSKLGSVPVEHFADAVRRHVKPLDHVSPASLAIQRMVAAFPNDG